LDKKLKDKVDYVLQIIISVERISTKFFKHLDDGIYEIRIEHKGDIYRIFSFFDEGRLIILLHGIQKKTQKTPRKEIDLAKELRREYYEKK
jgi:phage-related protein